MHTYRQEELRDELVAILGAGRELTPDADDQLADAFVRFLERQESQSVRSSTVPHQPHYSIALTGAAWGAVLTFLFILATVGSPGPLQFAVASVILISLTLAVTRTLLFMARNGWQIPHVHVTVSDPHGRGADGK